MRKYVLLDTFLLLIMPATILYGESDGQPKWNTTLYGSIFLPGPEFGIGGAVGYRYSPRIELEGEIFTISLAHYLSVSGGLLYNFIKKNSKTIPYVLGGATLLNVYEGDRSILMMFGGGVKSYLTKSLKIRLDIRFYLSGEGSGSRFCMGLMWSF